MITLEEAKKQARQYQDTADKLLQKYPIEQMLSEIGEFDLDGSYLYGWMVQPDIDPGVFIDKPDIDKVTEFVTKIMRLDGLIKANIVNYSKYPPSPGKPKGIYLGLKIDFMDELWNFDIWFVNKADMLDTKFFYKGWHKNVTQEQADSIILLKFQLKELGIYGKEFYSADVYRAVLKDGVRDIEQLRMWRQENSYI